MTTDTSQVDKKITRLLPLPQWELVCIVAALMSLNALAIDTMLPALSRISEAYELQRDNDQQLVVFAYVLGFGAPQLVYGPISDAFGRKSLTRVCLGGYILFGTLCMWAPTFGLLLALRFFQGVFASGLRVIAVSVVRDLLAGRMMARIMSLVFTVFMIVPIIAPGIGQVVMTYTSWHWTFGVLGVAGVLVLLWVEFRLPETLAEEDKRPLNLRASLMAYKTVLADRMTLGYMLASGVIFGALFAFISSSEQVFTDVFDQGDRFALWFAGIAASLGVASFANSWVVERIGMRKISHTVLLAFIFFGLLNLVLTRLVGENLLIFFPLFALTFACFGMIGANFSSIAMEPQGKNAGTASAAYGFATTTFASFFGWLVAGQFNGTLSPLLLGFTLLGVTSLVIVLFTERGKLFEPKDRA